MLILMVGTVGRSVGLISVLLTTAGGSLDAQSKELFLKFH